MVDRIHVLVVHVEPLARVYLARILGPEVDVHESGSGPDAITLLDHLRMNVVVVDAAIPPTGAGAFLDTLLARPVPAPPVVVIGAPTERAIAERHLAPGCVVWVDRPLDGDRFRAVVTQLSGRR
jgi:CheY-like chemotaxis protein